MEAKHEGIGVQLTFIIKDVLKHGKSLVALAYIQHQVFKKLMLRFITMFVRI
jgi:hypothetical protein